jgi:hypothetical protein
MLMLNVRCGTNTVPMNMLLAPEWLSTLLQVPCQTAQLGHRGAAVATPKKNLHGRQAVNVFTSSRGSWAAGHCGTQAVVLLVTLALHARARSGWPGGKTDTALPAPQNLLIDSMHPCASRVLVPPGSFEKHTDVSHPQTDTLTLCSWDEFMVCRPE